ncbi:DUF3348 domain-containing protein [Paraburkholderia bryophila]|uniref:DUF3348 family protein n=1 Tax=Paraburkholderia bryophila TaxID=420952 RepID=A0A7Y9W8Y7_9BURK|nr:DUF3348 domain-containing protein [Paraburkholderia bryophila]NYH16065.1 hypothetical protein [Paraburkholderia bryophila]NYH25499.1 hypothetical protein [Paraburkholderia bryophila]
MLQAPQRTALSGPALIRLLARLADVDVPESRQSLSDRLSQWLGWTDAIALSSALNGAPPAVPAGARAFGRAEEDECARVRVSLTKSVAGDSVLVASKRRGFAHPQAHPYGNPHAHMPSQPAPADAAPDYAVFRQRYQALQQSMETAVGTLRVRLRSLLAAKTPALARLAVLDAVMERALGERERNLLGSVPGLLAGHFERLRAAEQAALAAAVASDDVAAVTPGAWLDVFRKDMQSVLLAELDVRFQPVEGLLAALRTS